MAMTVAAVLTVVAQDRAGIVRAVASAVAEEGGNWIDSSLARLGGEFAGIVRIEAPGPRLSAIEARLRALASDGIQVSVRITGHTGAHHDRAGRAARLTLTSVDQPGIVAEISQALAALDVSIERFKSHVEPGSMSGAPLFLAEAVVRVPPGLDLGAVEAALAEVAADLMADLTLAADAAPQGTALGTALGTAPAPDPVAA
jgi:glycine cleavage system regulatory protein